jgi:hypothetical protein
VASLPRRRRRRRRQLSLVCVARTVSDDGRPQVVQWASCQPYLLAAPLCLLALYSRAAQLLRSGGGSGVPAATAGTVVAYVAAGLSKAAAVPVLVPLMALEQLLPLRHPPEPPLGQRAGRRGRSDGGGGGGGGGDSAMMSVSMGRAMLRGGYGVRARLWRERVLCLCSGMLVALALHANQQVPLPPTGAGAHSQERGGGGGGGDDDGGGESFLRVDWVAVPEALRARRVNRRRCRLG